MRRPMTLALTALLVLSLPAQSWAKKKGGDAIDKMMQMGKVEVEQSGDDQLSCEQLNAEHASLKAEMASIRDGSDKVVMAEITSQMAKAKGVSMVKSLVSGLIPGAGGLVGSAIDAATKPSPRSQMNSIAGKMQPGMERINYASQRIEHIQMLVMDKCMDEPEPVEAP